MSSILKVSEIQDPTNNNSALTVNSSGYVIMPQRPAFFVRAATLYSQTGKIKYSDDTSTGCFNQGGHYSTTDYQFTAPVEGIYTFSNQVYSQSTAQINLYFYLNSDVIAGTQTNQAADDGYEGSQLNVTIKMSANDICYISTSTSQYHTNAGYSFFSGHLVG